MKTIISILFICSIAYSQAIPVYVQAGTSQWVKLVGQVIEGDSVNVTANVDTNVVATKYHVSQNVGVAVVDSTVWTKLWKLGQYWSKASLDTAVLNYVKLSLKLNVADTTLLSNRINGKFAISDTGLFNSKTLTNAQLALKWNKTDLDTANRWAPKGNYSGGSVDTVALHYVKFDAKANKADSTTLFAGKLGGWIEIQRAADTTLNAANVTFVNLGELFFTMVANAVYEIEARIWFTKTTDASAYTLALNCGGTPTNIGLIASGVGVATDGTDQIRTSILNTPTDSIQYTAATVGNGKLEHTQISGQVINQNASNIFQFRWHQEIASSGVTIKRGSYLRYRRLY